MIDTPSSTLKNAAILRSVIIAVILKITSVQAAALPDSCQKLFRPSPELRIQTTSPTGEWLKDVFDRAKNEPDTMKTAWTVFNIFPQTIKTAEPDSEPLLRPSQRTRINAVKEVHQRLTTFTNVASVKTVLYPAAGADGATPFVLFPDAELVVALDNHPFFIGPPYSEPILSDVKERAGGNTGFVAYGALDHAQFTVGGLLARMEKEIPGFRLRGVTVAENRRRLNFSGTSKEIHGLIEFDRGDGTPPQYYLHLQMTDRRKLPTAWSAAFRERGFDALLVKGAMDIFRRAHHSSRREENIYVDFKDNGLGRDILAQALTSPGGVTIVDGDNVHWPWEQMPAEARGSWANISSETTNVDHFGYGTVRFIQIRPNFQNRSPKPIGEAR